MTELERKKRRKLIKRRHRVLTRAKSTASADWLAGATERRQSVPSHDEVSEALDLVAPPTVAVGESLDVAESGEGEP